MGNAAITSSWSRTYQVIKETHDEAYKAIEQAISYEEQENQHEAIEKYKEGILLIDKALDTPVTCPENPDFTWERARVMIQKMKKTRAEVLMRINSITASPNFIPLESPPSYEEAISQSSPRDVPRTYTDLAKALNDLQVESTDAPAEIIYSHDGVRLYFISPDGTVTQTSEPECLNIAVIPGNEKVPRRIFLQIGEWIYPLVPGVSPCYRTDYGAFILPDVHSKVAGASVGIILPPDADASVYELLENILHGIISQTIEPPGVPSVEEKPATLSETVSNGLVTGAYYVSLGLIKGAQKAGSLIAYGTPKIINNLTPASEATPISSKVSKGFEIASNATSTAAQVTGYVAEKVGVATQALGRYLAPHIQKQGTRLLTSGFHLSEEEASSKVNGILTVAAGAVEGFSTIYRGLETSASILGNSLSNNTVSIVKHRYGEPAGQLASNTFNTMGNVISITHNSKFLTPKGLAKTAAKETGRAMAEEQRFKMVTQIPSRTTTRSSSTSSFTSSSSSSSLYPNLQPLQQVHEPKTVIKQKSEKSDEKPSTSKEPDASEN